MSLRIEHGFLPSHSAVFSEDNQYRYLLQRGRDEPIMGVIMLNPSTADARSDDNTIRKVCGFAQRWGINGVSVVNLFAYRATNPKELRRVADPIGPLNDEYVVRLLDESDLVVVAWGVERFAKERAASIIRAAARLSRELWCFRETAKGHPEHPLYVPYTTMPIRWSGCPMLNTRN